MLYDIYKFEQTNSTRNIEGKTTTGKPFQHALFTQVPYYLRVEKSL